MREFREEVSQELSDIRQVAVMENLFLHHGARGHEIVFVFRCAFSDRAAYAMEFAPLSEGGVTCELAWVPLARLSAPAQLFPEGLLEHFSG